MYHDIQPTPKGNLISERLFKDQSPYRVYFDDAAEIWSISRRKFKKLNSIPFDGKPFTYGGIKFNSSARYDYDEDNITQKVLYSLYRTSTQHGYAWCGVYAYRMSFSMNYDELTHFPGRPFITDCHSQSWEACGFNMKFIINNTLHKIDVKREHKNSYFIYVEGRFYIGCYLYQPIATREEANIYGKLPNFTAIITPKEVTVVDGITLFVMNDNKIISTDRPFEYGADTLIISHANEKAYFIFNRINSEILFELRSDTTYAHAFEYYGFVKTALPGPPFYVKFTQEYTECYNILARGSVFIKTHNWKTLFMVGYIYNAEVGKKTKPAIH